MKFTFWLLFILSSISFCGLKDLATPKNFEIGPCIAMDPLRNETQYRNTIIAEFNRAVAENAFKMYIWTGPNSYNWYDTDYLVNFCRANGIKLRGHTLVWHAVVPSWLQNGNYTSDQVRQMLETYIKTVVGRYKNDIDEWDVVNEAISDSSPHGLRTSDSFWYQKLGPDFIRLAFQWAHEADPDCKLYYNDYGIEGIGGKSDGVYNLVSQLKSQGVPIHGVGWQAHLWHSWRLGTANYENLARLKALGLEVKITELDL
ncbi:MAG: endo-1,4-beta-xylanase, partial [Endomicrobiia bacterium]